MSGIAVGPYLSRDLKNAKKNTLHSDSNTSSENVVQMALTGCGLDAILAICLTEFCFGFFFANGMKTIKKL